VFKLKFDMYEESDIWHHSWVGAHLDRSKAQIQRMNTLARAMHNPSLQVQVGANELQTLQDKAPLPITNAYEFMNVLIRIARNMQKFQVTLYAHKAALGCYNVVARDPKSFNSNLEWLMHRPADTIWRLIKLEKLEFQHVLSEQEFETDPVFFHTTEHKSIIEDCARAGGHMSVDMPEELKQWKLHVQVERGVAAAPVPSPALQNLAQPHGTPPQGGGGPPNNQPSRTERRRQARLRREQANQATGGGPPGTRGAPGGPYEKHPQAFKTVWRAAPTPPPNSRPLGLIRVLRAGNSSLSVAMGHLNLDVDADCGNFYMMGECTRPGCTNRHLNNDLPRRGIPIVADILKRGIENL
jgi:hypothetical protein